MVVHTVFICIFFCYNTQSLFTFYHIISENVWVWCFATRALCSDWPNTERWHQLMDAAGVQSL